jgi:hypothetical protein
VAIGPVPDEALSMAGTAREFTPRSALLVTRDRETAEAVEAYVSGPSRVLLLEPDGDGTASWLAAGDAAAQILRWLRDTYN